jgi:hypothetical protein
MGGPLRGQLHRATPPSPNLRYPRGAKRPAQLSRAIGERKGRLLSFLSVLRGNINGAGQR